MGFILSLVQGTSSARAVLFDEAGDVAGISSMELGHSYPEHGRVEFDAMELWHGQRHVATQVLHDVGVRAEEIDAVALSNQRESFVVWDRETGEPICPAISWQDHRTAVECTELRTSPMGAEIEKRTGLVVDAYFSGTKLGWVMRHVPQARALASEGRLMCGTIDTWTLWQLTGGDRFETEPSNACRTLLYNLESGDWDPYLLEHFGIPREALPEIRDTDHHFGNITSIPDLAGLPVVGIAADQSASLFGQACFKPGMARSSYGSGSFVLVQAGAKIPPSAAPFLRTVAWQLGGEREFALEGSVFACGAVVDWLVDGLRILDHPSEVELLASRVDSADGVYFVPAFDGLGAPTWDNSAAGMIIGIRRRTESAHIARAALESIAFRIEEILSLLRTVSKFPLKELRVDGAAAENDLLLQMQADYSGIAVARPESLETAALGVAHIARLKLGHTTSRKDIEKQWRSDRVFKRGIDAEAAATALRDWRAALERSLGWHKKA